MIFHTRYRLTPVDLEARNSAVAHRLTELTANFTIVYLLPSGHLNF
ncbi:hemolysin expression modulating family protein [Escherichia coli]|nr:hemolysin expression modulating family protein [Escherichia coli]